MAKRYNFSVHDDLASLISKDAASRFVDDNDAIRAILAEHLTGRCSPISPVPSGLMATQPAPAGAPAPKATKADRKAALLAMGDAEMTAFLQEAGYFPKDGEEKVNEVVGSWRKHYVFTDEQGERQYRVVDIEKDGREGYRNIYFAKTGEFMNDLMRSKII